MLLAFADLPGDWELEIVGSAPDHLRERLDAIVTKSHLEGRVHFRGHLYGTDLDLAYESADCFVWPSYGETFGHPLLEAHAHGLPVLAARAGSNEEVAGASARYFDPYDVVELRRLLADAMAGNLAVGSLPREYSWDKCVEDTVAVLRQVAGR